MPCNLQAWPEAAATLPSGRSEIWAPRVSGFDVSNYGTQWNVGGPRGNLVYKFRHYKIYKAMPP